MFSPKNLLNKVKDAIPEVELPKLGREVDLPVYVIHNSTDPEDYFFLFDFVQFVEGTRKGWFVRPKLTVWAGRTDFGRAQFARQFRESFAREFDIARAQLAAEQAKPQGWFGYLSATFKEFRGLSVSEFLANMVLLVALSTGQRLLASILPSDWLGTKSDAAKLEDGIETTRAKVDEALLNIKISQHPELYAHAYRDGALGKNADLDRNAWPLPAQVRQYLDESAEETTTSSGSWW